MKSTLKVILTLALTSVSFNCLKLNQNLNIDSNSNQLNLRNLNKVEKIEAKSETQKITQTLKVKDDNITSNTTQGNLNNYSEFNSNFTSLGQNHSNSTNFTVPSNTHNETEKQTISIDNSTTAKPELNNSNLTNNNTTTINTSINTTTENKLEDANFEKVVYVKQISEAGKQALALEESGE